ncbi:trans-aconitate methyltransferase [Natranaerovirga hydrolytica]|uniref:Trans-aconitate methyltransferase n=1 Tax=Natranaerovirga hydrolytica TaxID=680378 RepID=A0A4R1MZT9_9FIRM|nr:P-loop NTPase fold protein [Natranaerovirga hydrolytica]TCK98140.1 trans-aconitate methyltransferase [Natranaerovirga hydrolytica]
MNKIDIRDIPISNEEDDYLNLEKYATALSDFIKTSETPITVSLQGEWGCGKTSLMNIIERKLCHSHLEDTYECISINTWELYLQGDEKDAIEHLTYLILKEIATITKEKNCKIEHELEDVFDNFKRYFMKTTDFIMGLQGTDTASRKNAMSLFNQNDYTYMKQLRNKLGKVVTTLVENHNNISNKGFIFFIDDLDRIQPSLAVKILEVLKNLFVIEKCIFVLAVDYEVIVRGLKEKYGDLNNRNEKMYKSYFDKLIQLPFVMPTNNYDITQFVLKSLVDIRYFDSNDELTDLDKKRIVNSIEFTIGKNPRSIKRLINALKLSRIYDEINEQVLINKGFKISNLMFLCIQLAYPKIYNMFEQYPIYKNWKLSYFTHLIDGQINNRDENDWKEILYEVALNDEELVRRIVTIKKLSYIIEDIFEYNEDMDIDKIWKVISLSALTNLSYMTSHNDFEYNGDAYNQSSETQYTQGNRLLDNVILKDDTYVLDVGCGNGKTTIDLFKKNNTINIDAFDLSKSQIDIAKKNRLENNISELAIKFYVKDAATINYKNKYDFIFSNASLHWITDATTMYTLLYNALKSGGQLAVHQGGYKSYYGLHDAVLKAIDHLSYQSYYSDWEYPVFYPTKEEMEQLLSQVGFKDISVISETNDGTAYNNLVENFCNASLLPYLNRLPKDDFREALIKEYYRICENEPINLYTHRLYIFAKKE